MLVFERGTSGIIRIGDNITIKVVAIRGNKVSLGIGCPKSVPVLREELLTREGPHPRAEAPVPDGKESP